MAEKKYRNKKKSGARRAQGRKKHGRSGSFVGLAVLITCAAVVGGLMIYGVATGKFSQIVEASDTAMESEEEIEAQKNAAAAAEAQKKAEEEKKAAEEKAAQEAAEKAEAEAKAAAEAKEKAEHPEFFADIQLTLPDGSTKEINRDLVETWETDNGDGTFTRDDEVFNQHITDFAAQLASAVDTVGKDHTFASTGRGTQTIPGNEYYGWQLDQSAEVAQIQDELTNSKTVTREPNYTMRESAGSNDNGGIGQTYCEIDASRQHLWIYQNGSLAFETDVVTGLMDQTHYTPAGVYLLLDKQTDATLKGETLPNGKRTYETPVSYLMPFTHTGIGLHDAWWKSVFGEGQNVWNGSHGCVNLPSDVAGTVYDLMTMTTPIVVYYSEDYTLRDAPESEVDKYIREQREAAAAAEAAQSSQDAQTAEQPADTQTTDTQPTEAPTPEPTQEAAQTDTTAEQPADTSAETATE